MVLKYISLLFLLIAPLFSMHYNPTILEIEAKLFPKMIIMSEDLNKTKESLEIYIVAKDIDFFQAEKFKELILHNYPKRLMGKKLKVSLHTFEPFTTLPDALIILAHTDEELKEIAKWANERKIISLSYSPLSMDQGVVASLYIGKSTKPYLNKEVIKKYHLKFNPYLLKLSKFR